MDVNEWMSYECSGEGMYTRNIHNSSTPSHPSEEENRTRDYEERRISSPRTKLLAARCECLHLIKINSSALWLDESAHACTRSELRGASCEDWKSALSEALRSCKRGFKVSTMYLVVLVVSDYCNKSTFFRSCHSCRIVEAYQPLRLQIIRWEWNSGTMFPLRCFMFIKLRLSPSLWLAGHCEFLFLLAGVRKVFYQQRKTVLNIWKMAR